jgi:hypothetical protein
VYKLADHYSANGDHLAARYIGWVIAGFGDVAIAGGHFAVDFDGGAADFDGAFVGGWFLEAGAGRGGKMLGRVVGDATDDGGGFSHDVDVGAEVAINDPEEWMGHGRRHWASGGRHHNDMDV